MKKFFIFLTLIVPVLTLAQEAEKFGIKFSGFVKSDVFFDSRQTVDARDGHFLLYPKNEYLDEHGDDINGAPKFNILAIQTRLKGNITGPDALGAKTSGVIEGAFFGNIGSDINGFRLRHAFIKLKWETSELLVGQYWHPMFVASCFPGTVSFNTGTPFQPFARNPQIRFTKNLGDVNIIASALTQVDFTDGGPDNASTKYIINNGFPELNLRLEYKSDNILIGIGGNYKSLMPRLLISTTTVDHPEGILVKTNERATGTSLFAYFQHRSEPFTVKLYGVMGQMMYSMTNLGGYAVKETIQEDISEPGSVTPVYKTTKITYTPTGTMSFWADIHSNGKTWQYGLFGGYSQNMGANDDITGANYSRGSDIKYLYRISPRLVYNSGKFRIAPEIEYTVAAYGTPDNKGIVENINEVGNFRLLIGFYYFF
ncbi:MAG: hypothetical protein K9G76_09235 [Bacteroidales bacterium]|nr:hypothetical protein [Bacteroidales bacterium]MCF8403734.1 hypothetical protein [Bacteroidales bacterium]